jgi:hypothetical protein
VGLGEMRGSIEEGRRETRHLQFVVHSKGRELDKIDMCKQSWMRSNL